MNKQAQVSFYKRALKFVLKYEMSLYYECSKILNKVPARIILGNSRLCTKVAGGFVFESSRISNM